jgi:ribosomal protein S18 acetylase RimI-like enzyme
VLRELRFLGKLGPLSLLFLAASSPVEGLLNGFVWEQDGRVVGNVTLSRPTGHARRWQISNVAVLDGYRGRGIGRSLVETALDAIVQRNGQTAYLYVREDNPAALHLYESLGFRRVDRVIDLWFAAPGRGSDGPASGTELRLLRRLRPQEGQALYELAAQARGAGQKWLGLPRRRRFVRTADERLFQWLGTGQRESFWGVSATNQRLRAGLSVRASSGWTHKPHRIEIWVHPSYRGRVEPKLAQDVVTLVARLSPRRILVSLPECDRAMVDALVERAFSRARTLILLKLEL